MDEHAGATATDLMQLAAAARGDRSLAEARGLAPSALDALWGLVALADGSGRPDLAVIIGDGLVALDETDPRCQAFLRRRVSLMRRVPSPHARRR